MYWDYNSIADYYAAKAHKSEINYINRRIDYLNSLMIVDAIFVPDRRAFINRDFNEDYTDKAVCAMNGIDDAVWNANKTLDSDMDIDEDLKLCIIETDSYIRVVGCTTSEGADLIEDAFLSCNSFGAIEIIIN